MKKGTAKFLQSATVLFGLAVLAFMLWEPNVEGVNANATFNEVYFDDPLLAYAYLASIPFFVGLYQIFKAFGLAGQSSMYSNEAVRALRTLKVCALSMIPLVMIGVTLILSEPTDDRPPILAMGTLVSLGSLAVALTAMKFEKRFGKLKNG